ncbi:MAG: type II toxin-antitoxin system VapC family toxin [Deltaproteobacteria bacterium]|nr:type II toxin-antitoxin system VapC family toxin [Deltaproteobacteria bacterium]
MIYYLDSSALVKRYAAESGSDRVMALVEGDQKIAVSWLAVPETLSAVARRAKGGAISTADLASIRGQLNRDMQRFMLVDVCGAPVYGIETLIARHALRGADSIHLSTALWLRKATKSTVVLVASDNELLAAARVERLKTLNPSEERKGFEALPG